MVRSHKSTTWRMTGLSAGVFRGRRGTASRRRRPAGFAEADMSDKPAVRNPTVRNTTWAELEVGDSASIERSCSVQDLILFAHVSGNLNPLMLPSEDGRRSEGRTARAVDVGRLAGLGRARQHPARPGHALPGAGPALPRPRPCRRQGHGHGRLPREARGSRSPYSTPGSSTPSGRWCAPEPPRSRRRPSPRSSRRATCRR